MLEELKPKRVFHYFEELTKIPRESGNEQEVSDFLYNIGKELGYETIQDDSNNVIIRKPAHPDYVDHEPVVLQGHMDMVAEKADGVSHDFTKDPIPLVVEDDWVKTKGTTLGADDGIAVAMGLAIIEDKEAKHPAIELLITTDEETTMSGARAVKKEALHGKKLLNIDAEVEGILLSGCSGGHNLIGTQTLDYQPRKLKNTFELTIKNMLGGHSGMEIHQERGNAIKFALQALDLIKTISDYELVSIVGGSKHNAIPRDAKVIFTSNEENFTIDFSDLIAKYPLDLDMEVTINQVEDAKEVLTQESKENIEHFIAEVPHGVYSMMEEYPDIVECSNNLAIFEMNDGHLKVTISLRSSNPETFDAHTKNVKNIYQKNGFKVVEEDYYKPWEFAKDSKLREVALVTYIENFGKEMKVEIVHAALEPAVFTETFPEMEMIAVGPTMKDVHSPKERLSISSTERTFKFIKKLLERL
ncbi:beta-Ala-His dipeptidase [Facklamia miroungae]|uniref:Cytosol non-specific dipeptidase n=1 Tax=Facklamia miroungae TaxID=120956 RepID=A0A1G7SIN6_9LACT|nr:beta-Ala-His dipeptidase [Facklamia miroungae]NKZ29636.1 aminoacyl-histidine dipeptidase [Facklamia miroungae]SDG22946.1 dipeptidase D [Facklamia miroungae]